MISYRGSTGWEEMPGDVKPRESLGSCDILVRKFMGRSAQYFAWKPKLKSADIEYKNFYLIDIDPSGLEAYMGTCDLTYAGAVNIAEKESQVVAADKKSLKSATVNGKFSYWVKTRAGDLVPRLNDPDFHYKWFPNAQGYETWTEYKKQVADIEIVVLYRASATSYSYVSKVRPTGPRFLGPRNSDVEILSAVASNFSLPQDRSKDTGLPDLSSAEGIEVNISGLGKVRVAGWNPQAAMTDLSANEVGMWHEVSETWEVEHRQ